MTLPRVQVGVRRGHDELQVVAGQPLVVHARDLLPGRGDRHSARNGPHDAARHRPVGRSGRVVHDARRGLGDDAFHAPDAGRQVEGRTQRLGRLVDATLEPGADRRDAVEPVARIGVEHRGGAADRVVTRAAQVDGERAGLADQSLQLRPPVGVGLGQVDAGAEHRRGEVGVDLCTDAVRRRRDRPQLVAEHPDELGQRDAGAVGRFSRPRAGGGIHRVVDRDRPEPVGADPQVELLGEGVELAHRRDPGAGEAIGVVARPPERVDVLRDAVRHRLEPGDELVAGGIRGQREALDRVADQVDGARETRHEPRGEPGVEQQPLAFEALGERRPQVRVAGLGGHRVEGGEGLALQRVLALQPVGADVGEGSG